VPKAPGNPRPGRWLSPNRLQSDVMKRKLGACRGDRIGVGLAPGVYFLRPEDREGRYSHRRRRNT
jgi:hypothetical protein